MIYLISSILIASIVVIIYCIITIRKCLTKMFGNIEIDITDDDLII